MEETYERVGDQLGGRRAVMILWETLNTRDHVLTRTAALLAGSALTSSSRSLLVSADVYASAGFPS